MTPGRLWYLLCRSLRRHPVAILNEALGWSRLARWHNPWFDHDPHKVPIHVLAGREQLVMLAWMLAGFHCQTQRCWRVYIHDDGSIGSDPRLRDLRRLFRIELIPRGEADVLVTAKARNLPRLLRLRSTLPMIVKLMDVRLLASADKVFLIDSDILFFKPPVHLIRWADNDDDHSVWFNAEPKDPSYLSPETVEQHLGKPAWQGLNAGLGCFPVEAIDLARCEEWLGLFPELQGTTWATNWRVEQSLYALCAASHAKGGLLPTHLYEVNHQPERNPEGIARHYIGPIRDLFWSEGVNTLKSQLQLQRNIHRVP